VEKALVSVIQEAWIGGVSTRRVDELARISHPVPGEGGFEGFLGVVGRFWNGAAGT
jgi:hypothetical protein